MENWFVVVMGIGTVFAVLILIIALCWLLGLACRGTAKKEEPQGRRYRAGERHSQPGGVPCSSLGSHCRGQRDRRRRNPHSLCQEAVKRTIEKGERL